MCMYFTCAVLQVSPSGDPAAPESDPTEREIKIEQIIQEKTLMGVD